MSKVNKSNIIKQLIYISHAISILTFLGIFAIDYKLGLQKSIIFIILTAIVITFFISGIITIFTFLRLYFYPKKRREIFALFTAAKERKGIIIDSRVGFSGTGLMAGIILVEKLRIYFNISLGSSLDWFLLLAGAIFGAIYGYYSLHSLHKYLEGWPHVFAGEI